MSDEGRLVAGRYRINKRIGTGAMGAVWQAQDELLGRTVAIKQLLLQPGLEESEAEEARQRTMREGRIAARLHHPNAITVFDVVTDDQGQPCLIMEYLDSTSLAAVVQQDNVLPPLEVARIGAQIAAALASAHRVDIVHRDIKPANILLTDDGVVKITDFGISRAKDDVTVTKTGMIAGTPAYLAPEVAIGEDPGPESDVFSLGSTLYAATEGMPPFGLSENTLGLLHAVAAGQINPPQRSGPLTSVLALLLHPEKARRPTASEAEEMLDAVARGETPVGGPVDADPTTMVASGALAAGAAGAAAAAGENGDAAAQTSLVSHSGSLDDATTVGAVGAGDDEATTYQPAAFYGNDGGTRTAVAAPTIPPDEAEPEERRKSWAGPAFAVGTLGVVAAFALWLFTSSPPENPNQQQPVGSTSSTTTEPTTTTTTTTTQVPVTNVPQQPQPQPEPTTTTTTTTQRTTTTTTKPTTTTTTPPKTTEPTTSSETTTTTTTTTTSPTEPAGGTSSTNVAAGTS